MLCLHVLAKTVEDVAGNWTVRLLISEELNFSGHGLATTMKMNSTKVQNPRHKMQVALLAEPKKTPLESSVFI